MNQQTICNKGNNMNPDYSDKTNNFYEVFKSWKEFVKTAATEVSEEDLPEDIKDNVLRIRQNLINAGINVETIYLTDCDIGGLVLAQPIDKGKADLVLNYYHHYENKNDRNQ